MREKKEKLNIDIRDNYAKVEIVMSDIKKWPLKVN